MRKFWKKYHKWAGIILTFFIIMFCLSGIVLNHRSVFSEYEVSRNLLPSSYKIENWNNGIVKGDIKTPDNRLLFFGVAGVWQTDSTLSQYKELNKGFKRGIDNKKVSNIVITNDNKVMAIVGGGLYVLNNEHTEWKEIELSLGHEEKLSDITTKGDTIVVVSRSYIYESKSPYTNFQKKEIKAPENYVNKVSLFKTVWLIHSGEIFGLTGKIVVDVLGIVLIMLCLTGVIYFFFPSLIKRSKKSKLLNKKALSKTLKTSDKWHRKLGVYTIILTVILSATGMCLRPPLMIPLIMKQTKPIPYSTLDSKNAWEGKLRAVRWDNEEQKWLISTSEGFYSIKTLNDIPEKIKAAPMISPMGINVFEKINSEEYLIGSFSGLFVWNIKSGIQKDYFTGEVVERKGGRPIGRDVIAGYSKYLNDEEITFFDYGKGIIKKNIKGSIAEMPKEFSNQPMSLWNVALEVHVGRCYTPFLWIFSELFVFLFGLFITLVLISGYIISKKKKKK